MRINTINEERLFEKIHFFFENPSSALIELAQNAHRAGATKMDVFLKDTTLTIYDNGKGIEDPASIVVLAESDWSEDIEMQNPAGWGIYMLLCNSLSVKFSSAFGSLAIDCTEFFKNKDYRETVLERIAPKGKFLGGTKIEAVLKDEVVKSMLDRKGDLCFFPFMISVNGEAIKWKSAEDLIDYNIETTYEGNGVYIDVSCFRWYSDSLNDLASRMSIIWYGIPIYCHKHRCYTAVVMDVVSGSPVCPVLPYRQSIKKDEKLSKFADFIKKKVVDYCIEFINNSDSGRSEYDLLTIMAVMEQFASQEELNMLNKFYITEKQPFYSDDLESRYSKDIIVAKGDTDRLVSETPSIQLKYEDMEQVVLSEEKFYDELCLPEGTITQYEYPKKNPDWLRIKERPVLMTVNCVPNSRYDGAFSWRKADITCEGKPVNAIALYEDYSYGKIFYRKTPKNFYEIYETVFNLKVYYQDGDTYDTQQSEYSSEIDKDIKAILREYTLWDLLKSLNSVPGIKVEDIKRINITDKHFRIKNRNGDSIVLRLAA